MITWKDNLTQNFIRGALSNIKKFHVYDVLATFTFTHFFTFLHHTWFWWVVGNELSSNSLPVRSLFWNILIAVLVGVAASWRLAILILSVSIFIFVLSLLSLASSSLIFSLIQDILNLYRHHPYHHYHTYLVSSSLTPWLILLAPSTANMTGTQSWPAANNVDGPTW